MSKLTELSNLVDNLIDLFTYQNDILYYNNITQAKASRLFEKIAKLSNTFEENINKEKINIRDELTIVDAETGKRIPLVDTNSMETRVKNLLKDNNMFTCLKSLALSNKCAHIFDGRIKSASAIFNTYYNMLYPNNPINEEISFSMPPEDIFPNIIDESVVAFYKTQYELKKDNELRELYNELESALSTDLDDESWNKLKILLDSIFEQKSEYDIYSENYIYNLSDMNDETFKKLITAISSKSKKISKEKKMAVLRNLKIKYNRYDDEEINKKYDHIVKNKDRLLNEFLIKKYYEGMECLELQNKMFAIKNIYTAMIGQLLKTNLKGVKYELIKTPNPEPGFEYMLIIDDKELSYYIEVHMPNYIGEALKRKYGLVESSMRSTLKLSEENKNGASAVYKRDIKEVKKIYEALENYSIQDEHARKRGGIITRDYSPTSPLNIETTAEEIKPYSFITQRIKEKPTLFEKFTEKIPAFKNELQSIKRFKENENYPQDIIMNAVNNNYLKLFNKFNHKEKKEFINYGLENIKNGDMFDNILYMSLEKYYNNHKLDTNITAKILVFRETLKTNFINKNVFKINKILFGQAYHNYGMDNYDNIFNYNYYVNNKYNKKAIIDSITLIKDNIDDYLEKEINKERDNYGPSHTR